MMRIGLSLLVILILPITVSAADDVMERAVPSDPRFQRSIPALQPQTPEQQIAILQQQVQALQAQIAALQSVLKIASNGAVTILSPTSISVQAGTNVAIGAGTQMTIQSNGPALVEGKGAVDLKGFPLKMNGGTKPLATVGSQVQVPGQPIGLVTTGSQTILAP